MTTSALVVTWTSAARARKITRLTFPFALEVTLRTFWLASLVKDKKTKLIITKTQYLCVW